VGSVLLRANVFVAHACVVLALAGCPGERETSREPALEPPTASFSDSWLDLQVNEEVLALLQAQLLDLQRGMGNLALPDAGARHWFSGSVRTRDVDHLGPYRPSELPVRFGVEEASVSYASQRTLARDELSLLKPLFHEVYLVRDARLAAKRGRFLDDDRRSYEVTVGVSLLGTGRDGGLVDADGVLLMEAELRSEASEGTRAVWDFTSAEVLSLSVRRRLDGPLFEDVLPQWVSEPLRTELQRSRHEEYVDSAFADPQGFERPTKYWDPVSHDRHPALSVVDVDGDGLDELYVMARWGPNILLSRQPDGTWVDRAPELGLDVVDHSSAALFADLDNDGDIDVLVGRTLERSVLLMQEQGVFVDRSLEAGASMPRLVSGVSAADVDGDGLLDLHIATYGRKVPPELAPELWPEDEAERFALLAQEPILDAAGPANVLLRNLGGGAFADVSHSSGLAVQRQSFHGSFADVDGDSAPDLYLANDFAPNTLLLNDGTGKYSPAPGKEPGQGFGMGASFGDIDGDGDPDLYLSNMYSKAGERVLAALPGVDGRYAPMARGNSLLRNDGGSFVRVSGRTEETAQVEASGWSWSGLMSDLDSDGWLDLAVLNGYFTPPRRHALPVDI